MQQRLALLDEAGDLARLEAERLSLDPPREQERAGDTEGAVADYERVVAERPASPAAPRAVVGVGDVRFDQERFADAEAAYRRAVRTLRGAI